MAYRTLVTLAVATQQHCFAVRHNHNVHEELKGPVNDIADEFQATLNINEGGFDAAAPNIPVPTLVQLYEALADKMGPMGFGAAADHLKKNINFMKGCGEMTVAECVHAQSEITETSGWSRKTKPIHTKRRGDTPASIKGDTPLIGLMWCNKFVGFMGELFDRLSTSERPWDLAGISSEVFRRQVATVWAGGFSTDAALEGLVRHGITSAMPDESTLVKSMGGEEEAIADMKSFASITVPLTNSVRKHILEAGFDDCKKDCWYME